LLFLRSLVKMFSPIMFSQRQDWRSSSSLDKPYPSLDLAIPIAFGYSVLLCTVGVGVAGLTLLAINGSAVAQMSSMPDRMPLGERTLSQVNVVFVNPSIGDDTKGNGSDRTPFKTITQALRVATGNTVIMLTPGIYSTETGEVFPLMLKAGVSIQGDTSNKGSGITIQGGGAYLSRSFGGQNVTIVGANQAGLTGVTVTNPNPRGYGLWIESSNPVIAENTFTGSTQDGVAVSGTSAPTINKNYFYRNGANGITLGGNSQAKVQENIFQETGFGVNITQNAAPIVMGNQIQNNRSGILVQGKAQPILRNNLIADSKEDGLVAIAQAMPNLGTATEPGGNEFRNNTRYDINASAAKQAIAAAGNTLTSDKIAGKVDFNAQVATVTDNPQPVVANNINRVTTSDKLNFNAQVTTVAETSQPVVANNIKPVTTSDKLNFNAQVTTVAETSQPATPNNIKPVTTSDQEIIFSAPEVPKITNQATTILKKPIARRTNPLPLTPPTSGFPVPSSLAAKQPAPRTQLTSLPRQSATPQLNYVQINTNTIEFTAPNSVAQPPQSPAPLPVPDGNVPLGNTRNLRKVPVPETNTTAYNQSYLQPARGTRYRIIVEVTNDREQELVRFVAPGAFSTIWQGRRVMQAGVFSDRTNADEMLKTLTSNGLRTMIEPLN
jgi:parallel beta-helix repeat protein